MARELKHYYNLVLKKGKTEILKSIKILFTHFKKNKTVETVQILCQRTTSFLDSLTDFLIFCDGNVMHYG